MLPYAVLIFQVKAGSDIYAAAGAVLAGTSAVAVARGRSRMHPDYCYVVRSQTVPTHIYSGSTYKSRVPTHMSIVPTPMSRISALIRVPTYLSRVPALISRAPAPIFRV